MIAYVYVLNSLLCTEAYIIQNEHNGIPTADTVSREHHRMSKRTQVRDGVRKTQSFKIKLFSIHRISEVTRPG